MGCFLACFGFHKRRKKHRSPADGVTFADQIHLSYEPLDSSRITCGTNDRLETRNSKLRDRPREQPWIKIRKKVSFNLNVQIYEPVPNGHSFLESDEEVQTEEDCQLQATARTYPQNHRYKNCGDSYYDDEEEDDFAYGESDLDDSEIDEDHDKFRSCELEINTVDRGQQVHSVLKPVENLTQWRTAKAKAGRITNKHQMENKIKTSDQPHSRVFFCSNPSLTKSPSKPRSNSSLPDTRMQENLVHSSLSNWLV